jgi:coenzyme F420-reducing hydrogenase gamma subunit
MGLSYNVYLTANKIFGCKGCKTHLADFNEIMSRVWNALNPLLPTLLL